MVKRPFERVDGYLVDRDRGPNGQQFYGQFPERFVRATERDCRDEAMAALRSGPGPYPGTLIDDGDDGSREYCDALLQALRQGADLDVPHALLRHLHDERVRPALVEALKTATSPGAPNLAQVVGIAGGLGALETLREWGTRVAGDEATFQDTGWHDELAGMLCIVCEGQLWLNPDELPAAHYLLRLFEHPVALHRRVSVRAAAELCGKRTHLRTAALELLRDGFEPFVFGDDDGLFVAALPGLARAPRQIVVQRIEALVLGTDPALARQAIAGLCDCFFLVGERNRILAQCLEGKPTLDTAIYVISWLAGGFWSEEATVFLRQALGDASPLLRWHALACLDRVPRRVAIELAEGAFADEPDPLLQSRLGQIAGTERRA